MSTATVEQVRPVETAEPIVAVEPVVAIKRRTIDSVLIGFGVVATAAFVVAGGLLTWGHNFSSDYVGNELSSQNITFPSAADLTEEGRTDLLQYADQQLDTGAEAEAYASFINGHLEGIADGADLRRPRRTGERRQGRGGRSRRRRPAAAEIDDAAGHGRCRQRPAQHASSRARRCAACSCRPTPGRRSARSPASPPSAPSSPPA